MLNPETGDNISFSMIYSHQNDIIGKIFWSTQSIFRTNGKISISHQHNITEDEDEKKMNEKKRKTHKDKYEKERSIVKKDFCLLQ